MTTLSFVIGWMLLLSLATGLLRILRGPTAADRMLASQLLGTTGVAVLLVLGHVMDIEALFDVALVFASLAAIACVAFVRMSPLIDTGKARRRLELLATLESSTGRDQQC